jgi:hypothetical protein
MGMITLANGQHVNVDSTNVASVTQQAINAQRAANAANGSSFGYQDQVALSTAVNEAASGNSVVAPSDYSIFGTYPTLTAIGTGIGIGVTGSSGGGIAGGEVGANLGATLGSLPDLSRILGLPSSSNVIIILALGVVGLIALAYIAHKAL